MSQPGNNKPLPEQIASAVRGPAALRDDIADEIADHLTSRVEEDAASNPTADPTTDHPTAAEDAALRAFGNPDEIARELRAIHLGDRIMFQRITIAALIVIVIGMATTSYFSWSAARESNRRLMEFTQQMTQQTTQQFGELTKHLASLNNLEQATQPPQLKVLCYSGTPAHPVSGYRLTLASIDDSNTTGKSFSNEYTTDDNGWIDTGPLPLGSYQIRGRIVSHTTETIPDSLGSWTRVVRLQQNGLKEDVRLNVSPPHKYAFKLVIPPEITWDIDAMPSVAIRFERKIGPRINTFYTETWDSQDYVISTREPTTIEGLLPGQATVRFCLPQIDTSEVKAQGYAHRLCKVDIPHGDGPITLELPINDDSRITGIVYDGTKDNPVVGARIQLPNDDRNKQSVETLVTDSQGRFGSFSKGGVIKLEWKTADGKPSVLFLKEGTVPSRSRRAPQPAAPQGWFGRSLEIDVSKLATVRFAFSETENLKQRGICLTKPLVIQWHLVSQREDKDPFSNEGFVEVAWPDETVKNLLLFPGRSELTLAGDTSRSRGGYEASMSFLVDLEAGELREYDVAFDWGTWSKGRSRRTGLGITTRPAGDVAASQPAADGG